MELFHFYFLLSVMCLFLYQKYSYYIDDPIILTIVKFIIYYIINITVNIKKVYVIAVIYNYEEMSLKNLIMK